MFVQGSFVEYIEHGKFICAAVVEEGGKRLRLINQNGREVKLPQARVVHHTPRAGLAGLARDEMLRELKAAGERRRELAATVNLETVWEIAVEEKEERFEPRLLAELAFGEEAGDDQVAAFLRCVFEDRLYFKFKEGMITVHSVETVEQLRQRLERERQREALLDRGGRALARVWSGEAEPDDWPDRQQCLELVRDFYLFGNEAAESALAKELLKRAGLTRPHDAFHLLVKAGVWQPDENLPLLRYEVPVAFPGEALAQAEELAATDPAELLASGRRDLRSLPLITIDGEETRDFDDALHLERCENGEFVVGVHIADVAHYVKPETPLYREAARRVTSLYFPEQQVPMLPRVLSEGICSLVAGQPRAALSFLVRLTENGDVKEFDVVPSVVTVQRQLTYRQVESLLADDEDLAVLEQLGRALQQRRIAAGALLLPIPDVVINVDDPERPTVSLLDPDSGPRQLVAEFMVMANTLAAEFVAERQVPGLFRSQEGPRQRLVHGLQKDLFLNWRQRKQLAPGKLLTEPRPHSGVGAFYYTTVTSPIRRFLDLVMQTQLHALIARSGRTLGESELKGLIDTIITTQSRLNLVRQLRHRYWLLKYLKPREGERAEALLTERGPKRTAVVLADCLLECELPASRSVAADPGEIVNVTLTKVDPLDNQLRLDW